MSVLITGISGFIGSSLARKLADTEHDIYGLVRHISRAEASSLEAISRKIRLVEGDLIEYHSIRSAIQSISPEVVIHLGALTPVRHSFEDPFPYFKTNFQGTMNIVHSILDVSPKTRLIAASTAEVYGWQPQRPCSEDDRLNPSSPYAVSKAAADNYLQMAIKVYGLNATVLRCNNTYGRHAKGFLVEYLVTTMLQQQTVHVGAPSHVRDYMYVDDHVNAYVRALENERAVGQNFNVSPGNPITNIDLAKMIANLTGFKGEIIAGSYPPGYPMRPAKWDTEYIVLNSEKIRSMLEWKPSVTLEDGLRRAVAMHQDKLTRSC